MQKIEKGSGLRRVLVGVAALNFAYFAIEFAVAARIGSVSLFADSVDFVEDAAVNLLILLALRWTATARSRVGFILALILLAPGIATLWTAWHKISQPLPPAPIPLTFTAIGALMVNLFCAILLNRFREHSGSLTRAAFLSARNDAVANLAMIGAGMATATVWLSAWPDFIVGAGIAMMNADAAHEVWRAAKAEGTPSDSESSIADQIQP